MMKKKIIAGMLLGGIIIMIAAFKYSRQKESTTTIQTALNNKELPGAIAVIELFTSQGCSSCPPADKLLNSTISKATKEGQNVFALSFHVDYWNRLGWTDPFSDARFSERQRNYAAQLNSSVYTPQMLVNGSKEFVGSDAAILNRSLEAALNKSPLARFSRLSYKEKDGDLQVDYELEGDYNNTRINFAVVSLSETTSIKRGENGGLTLTNENVVRQFTSAAAAKTGSISFKAGSLPPKNNRAVIAYIQNNDNLKIIGAAKALEG
jgi:hypothetical protein